MNASRSRSQTPESFHSEHTSAWLLLGAERLGVPPSQARTFARSAQLSLPGLTLQLSPWQTSPVQRWVAIGLLPRPYGLRAEIWSELLLRSNCAISAMSNGSVALDDSGNALLVLRLTSQPRYCHEMLADELSHLLSIAESLVAGATALESGTRGLSQPVAAAPTQGKQSAQLAQTAMNQQWHRPILIAAMQHLGAATPALEQIMTVGLIQVNGRSYEVIADGDHEHLLISTSVPTLLKTAAQRERALLANLHLMMLTQCAVVQAPHESALQARWNSIGLDGKSFADWLLDFGRLADSFLHTSAIRSSSDYSWTR